MSKKAKSPVLPPAWKLARKAVRVDVMHSRVHGTQSRRTQRRKAKQAGWADS